MFSRLFEEVLNQNRPIEDELTEYDSALENFNYIEDETYRGPEGMLVWVPQRSKNEFMDAVARIIDGGAAPEGASKVIKKWSDDVMPELLSTVEKLPSIFRNMYLVSSKPNYKDDRRPWIEGFDYYESPIKISGKTYWVNVATKKEKDKPGDRTYYFHCLKKFPFKKLGESKNFKLLEVVGISVRS